MRVVESHKMQIGEVDISQVKFDPSSRDDMPKILKGLQHLYMNLLLRKKIFGLLESRIAPDVDKYNGRPGMALWPILVCGVVRLDLNIDYDRLHDLANNHATLRTMLGHDEGDRTSYHYQTLMDNVLLLEPELLDEINALIVTGGHVLVKKFGKKKRPAKPCVGGATLLSLKHGCISLPTSASCTTPCARSSSSRRSGASGLM